MNKKKYKKNRKQNYQIQLFDTHLSPAMQTDKSAQDVDAISPTPTSGPPPQPNSENQRNTQSYFACEPQELYTRKKLPFLIHPAGLLASAAQLLTTTYFTVPYYNMQTLGEELGRILSDAKCQAPSNVGVMLASNQSVDGTKQILEMIYEWAEKFRVPAVIINIPSTIEVKKIVLEHSVARHEIPYARVILCDNITFDLNPTTVATTILTLVKKATHHSSAGGGVQRPIMRGGSRGREWSTDQPRNQQHGHDWSGECAKK